MEILFIILSIIILLFSSILHEIAHGLIAYRLGDPTAKLMGRLTLNPKAHIDPFMSILVPLMVYIGSAGRFIFGGAKPVQVDPFNLRDGMKDLALVSLAGPATNILLAISAAGFTHLLFPGLNLVEIADRGIFGFVMKTIIEWNILLAVLNLLPIPPLDGSKIFALLLPDHVADSYLAIGNNGFGLMLLILLLYFPIGPFSLSQLLGVLMYNAIRILGFA